MNATNSHAMSIGHLRGTWRSSTGTFTARACFSCSHSTTFLLLPCAGWTMYQMCAAPERCPHSECVRRKGDLDVYDKENTSQHCTSIKTLTHVPAYISLIRPSHLSTHPRNGTEYLAEVSHVGVVIFVTITACSENIVQDLSDQPHLNPQRLLHCLRVLLYYRDIFEIKLVDILTKFLLSHRR